MARLNRYRITILIFVLFLIGGYVYFYDIRSARRAQENLKVEKIFDFRPEDVREIVLSREDQIVLLRKGNDQWRIEKPFQSIADNRTVSDLLSVFNYGMVRVVDPNSSNYGKYGLERPEIEFGIKVGESPVFQTLLIGNRNPTNISCYARVRGRPGVLLIGGGYETALRRALSHFQSR